MLLRPLRMASLFSGFAGLDIGLEMGLNDEGIEVEHTALCEHFVSSKRPHRDDDYPRRLLEKRFPGVPLLGDVATIDGAQLGQCDMLVGGFPCTDISTAKASAEGLAGSRSGLWFQQLRLIREKEPLWCLIENVAALRSRGLWAVLHGLWESGYAAQYDILSARSVGAPHLRERIFILATRLDVYEGPVDFVDAMPTESEWSGQWWPLPWREGKRPANDKPRIKGLGNAVVPQVAAVVGRAMGRTVLDMPTPLLDRKGRPRLYPMRPETKFPRAGCIDLDSGEVVELRPAAPPNKHAARYLLPTPTTARYGSSGNGIKKDLATGNKASLETLAREGRIPTPTASAAAHGRNYQQRTRDDGTVDVYPTLEGLVREARTLELEERLAASTVPTPTASDCDGQNTGYLGADGVRKPSLNALVKGAQREAQRTMLEQRLEASTVPTPQSRDERGPVGRGSKERGGRSGCLPTLVLEARLAATTVPTPTAGDAVRGGFRRQRIGRSEEVSLVALAREARVAALLEEGCPTPTTRDWRSGKASEATHGRNARPLNEAITQAGGVGVGGSLSPLFVEWLMGLPLGWTDIDD